MLICLCQKHLSSLVSPFPPLPFSALAADGRAGAFKRFLLYREAANLTKSHHIDKNIVPIY